MPLIIWLHGNMWMMVMIDAKMTKVWLKTSFHPTSSARMKTIWGLSLFSSLDFQKLFFAWPPRKSKKETMAVIFILCQTLFNMNWGQRMEVGWLSRARGPCDRFKRRARVVQMRDISFGFDQSQHSIVLVFSIRVYNIHSALPKLPIRHHQNHNPDEI